jgi:hypothetical protein
LHLTIYLQQKFQINIFSRKKNVSEKENKNIHLTLEKKNCASADVNLKYKFLSDGKNQMENADKAQINRTENQAKVG